MNLVRAVLVAFGSCFLQVAWCDTLGDTQAGNLRGPQANSTAVVPVPQRILSSSHSSSIHERDLLTGHDHPSLDSRDYGSKWDRTHHLERIENVIVDGDKSGNRKQQQFFYVRPPTAESLVKQANLLFYQANQNVKLANAKLRLAKLSRSIANANNLRTQAKNLFTKAQNLFTQAAQKKTKATAICKKMASNLQCSPKCPCTGFRYKYCHGGKCVAWMYI